jgi:hypothetical protein
MRRLQVVVFIVFWLFPSINFAGVNSKNGNFYISYTDVDIDGLEITRTFNSKSTKTGQYGKGWASQMETKLTRVPGGFNIRHHGGGSSTQFHIDTAEKDRDIGLLALTKVRYSDIASDEAVKFANKARDSFEYLLMYWVYHLKENPELINSLPKLSPPMSLVGQSIREKPFRLEVENTGYTLISGTEKTATFDSQMRIIEYFQKEGSTKYNWQNYPEKLTLTSNGESITLHYLLLDDIHLVSKITSPKGIVDYQYDLSNRQQPLLVYSKDLGGNEYFHQYDAGYNMTQIGYVDGESMTLSYSPVTHFTGVVQSKKTSVSDAPDDPPVRMYEYFSDPNRPVFHYGTQLSEYNENGLLLGKKDVNYLLKRGGALNEKYTYYMSSRHRGIEQNVWYNEKCNLPIKYTVNGIETRVEYSQREKLECSIEKITSNEMKLVVDYTQDGEIDSLSVQGLGSVAYRYDDDGKNKRLAPNTDHILAKRISHIFEREIALFNDAAQCKCTAWR